MSTFRELLADTPTPPEQPLSNPIREQLPRAAATPTLSVHDEQIHVLVQQLFFPHESDAVRHVGFAAIEASAATASLCLDVALALAEEDRYKVGLVDANLGRSCSKTNCGFLP